MRKTRKAAAVLTAFAMAAVSAVPAMADEIKDLYDYEVRQEKLRLGTFTVSADETIRMYLLICMMVL